MRGWTNRREEDRRQGHPQRHSAQRSNTGDEGRSESTPELHREDGHEHQDRSAHKRHHNDVVAKFTTWVGLRT